MVPLDFIANVAFFKELVQRLLKCPPIGLSHLLVKRQGGVIHEVNAVSLLQYGHPLPQGRLRPQAQTCQQENK